MSDDTTQVTDPRRGSVVRAAQPVPALAVVWSRSEPHRVGEVAVPPDEGAADDGTFWFGREHGAHSLELMRQRPGASVATGPPSATGISRRQWKVEPRRGVLAVENVGRRELLHNGVSTTCAQARVGDLLELRDELLVMVVVRAREFAARDLPSGLLPSFGEADEFGLVGESATAWELRRQLAFAAGRADHVLLTGPSGSGKELAARAIHGLSSRRTARLIARNVATLPEALIDAELFGNARDYPNPGMPDRPGLVGAADGSTLLLDEIGEISHPLQAHLLRLIDGGEYHRLGESHARRADVRVVAATNRDPATLKHDLLARLRLRIRLPGLERRREDIPLIARHLLREMARQDPVVAERAFDGDVVGEPVWTAAFLAGLVTAAYPTHVRELQTRLWEAIGRSGGAGLSPPSMPSLAVPSVADDSEPGDHRGDPSRLTVDQVRAALQSSGGSRERAWRTLGLRSRHQLLRVMRRLGIDAGKP